MHEPRAYIFCRCEVTKKDFAKVFFNFFFSHIVLGHAKAEKSISTMAVFNNFTKICWKNFQSDQLNKQLFYVVRSLHKSAASEALGISATEEETMPNRMIKPEEVSEKTQIKTLNDMPGPNTLSNLIEFFWKDGFGRIHEIQVMVLNLMLHFVLFS